MGMWRTRKSVLNQKAQVAEPLNNSEERSVLVEDVECFLDVEDTKMSKLYVAELPLNVGDWFYNVLCRNPLKLKTKLNVQWDGSTLASSITLPLRLLGN